MVQASPSGQKRGFPGCIASAINNNSGMVDGINSPEPSRNGQKCVAVVGVSWPAAERPKANN